MPFRSCGGLTVLTSTATMLRSVRQRSRSMPSRADRPPQDGVQTPGALTFEVNRTLVADGVTATETEVAHAVSFAFHELKLVVEPGGAVALAALLAGKLDIVGKTAVVVLSGGNIDPELFARLVA